ncbi:hypothetical protein [Burkholderia stagnalis]|uniref:hypothetical protein n=1 Tax=Burkholderia stagnalis TaxID=1503054 RepID=UPI0007583646|nr:hypothetical protein [Burkholderia stagnalis]KVO61351.1 hypothetical protein WT18_08980 [Burkholderia stagnalis]KVP12954.1 hypothetical protein WT20_10685 [Burkholderia stagnalis]KVW96466.1 hypothetical protein WT30_11750 [Burkholderia stagnalis]KWH75589.1 hypothetical protein WT66_01980 [Burkholderia stagnalis]RQQ30131.1 hypothetical protein DF163_14810 [Burkholderia stagnalis]
MKTMYYRIYVAQELELIDAMLSQLEHVVRGKHTGRRKAAAMLSYWRVRIGAIAGVPQDLQPRVNALLARLDAIDAASRQLRSGHASRPAADAAASMKVNVPDDSGEFTAMGRQSSTHGT